MMVYGAGDKGGWGGGSEGGGEVRQASHERRVVPPYIAHLSHFLLLLKSRVKGFLLIIMMLTWIHLTVGADSVGINDVLKA